MLLVISSSRKYHIYIFFGIKKNTRTIPPNLTYYRLYAPRSLVFIIRLSKNLHVMYIDMKRWHLELVMLRNFLHEILEWLLNFTFILYPCNIIPSRHFRKCMCQVSLSDLMLNLMKSFRINTKQPDIWMNINKNERIKGFSGAFSWCQNIS